MNNQEAIYILGQYDVSNIHFYTTDGEEIPFTEWSDAIEMAISALQAQEAKHSTCNQLVTDTISRTALCEYALNQKDKSVTPNDIMRFPSAQPEIIHCRDCKHHRYDRDIPYCDRIDYGYGWKDDEYCSRAERRTDEGD